MCSLRITGSLIVIILSVILMSVRPVLNQRQSCREAVHLRTAISWERTVGGLAFYGTHLVKPFSDDKMPIIFPEQIQPQISRYNF